MQYLEIRKVSILLLFRSNKINNILEILCTSKYFIISSKCNISILVHFMSMDFGFHFLKEGLNDSQPVDAVQTHTFPSPR